MERVITPSPEGDGFLGDVHANASRYLPLARSGPARPEGLGVCLKAVSRQAWSEVELTLGSRTDGYAEATEAKKMLVVYRFSDLQPREGGDSPVA